MPTLEGHTRTAFLCFFASHIPITFVIDGQAFLPRQYYPQVLRDLVDWYAATFKDKLMTYPFQPWFSSIVALEVLLQVPFFFLAIYALLQHSKNGSINNNTNNALIKGDGLFRSLCLIYGSSTATTLVPILGCIIADEDTTVGEKGLLLGFYLPYLIFPLWLVVIAVSEENVFGVETAKKRD